MVGLAIPFGVFRDLLDRPMAGTGQGAYDWMVSGIGASRGFRGQRVASPPSGCGRAWRTRCGRPIQVRRAGPRRC